MFGVRGDKYNKLHLCWNIKHILFAKCSPSPTYFWRDSMAVHFLANASHSYWPANDANIRKKIWKFLFKFSSCIFRNLYNSYDDRKIGNQFLSLAVPRPLSISIQMCNYIHCYCHSCSFTIVRPVQSNSPSST